MSDRNQVLKASLYVFTLLLCLSTLPVAVSGDDTLTRKRGISEGNTNSLVVKELRVTEVSGTEAYNMSSLPQQDALSEGWYSPLILKDVSVEDVPVLRASSDHFILEWIEHEVDGEAGEGLKPEYGLSSQPELPKAYSLSQNYPNPFNPSTTIAFDLPGTPGEMQPVALVIYDMRGRRVTTLIDTDYGPGSYTVAWNGRDDQGRKVSSGIYLYTLRAGGERFTRKMTILK